MPILVEDRDTRELVREIGALASAQVDRGADPVVVINALIATGSVLACDAGLRLVDILAGLSSIWNTRGGKL